MKLNNLKRMVVGVGAAAMMMSAMAVGADAAASDWTDEAKVTVNMYIPRANNPVIKLWNAYFTNPVIPPNAEVEDNATVKVDGNKAYLEVPVTNSGFSIYLTDENDLNLNVNGTTLNLVESRCDKNANGCTETTNGTSHEGVRYTKLVYDITDFTGDTVNTTIASIKSHAKANISIAGVIKKDNDSVQTTPVKVEMNLSAAR